MGVSVLRHPLWIILEADYQHAPGNDSTAVSIYESFSLLVAPGGSVKEMYFT